MKAGRCNGGNQKYFCALFKLTSCNATALHPGSSAEKKGDAFKHLPKIAARKPKKSAATASILFQKYFANKLLTQGGCWVQSSHLDMIKPPVQQIERSVEATPAVAFILPLRLVYRSHSVGFPCPRPSSRYAFL